MEEGAFGLSSGLFYAPGSYARTQEVIELAKVAAEYEGVYTSHIRDEADYNIGVVAAVDEVIRISREAQLPAIVTHILPAAVFGMKGRGLIREGAMADVVVFDLVRIRDKADYQHPHQLSEGIIYLLVNGNLAIDNAVFGDTLHGRVLSHPAK